MPTALELGPEGWKPFVEAFRRRAKEKLRPEDEAAREELVARTREAARVLKKVHGAGRVVLFGSLAHRAWFDPRSDVDLAVEGLSPGVYWGAWRAVEEFFPDRKVDLIEYEMAGGALRQAIDHEGIEL
jgi:predicted nucleotidyltransferase